ncbi:transposase [Amphibacillus jilinensis]|nr:transposase [Amphibacillus jilinensis]
MLFAGTAFSYPYSNGRIEGINKKISALSRFAYGYISYLERSLSYDLTF